MEFLNEFTSLVILKRHISGNLSLLTGPLSHEQIAGHHHGLGTDKRTSCVCVCVQETGSEEPRRVSEQLCSSSMSALCKKPHCLCPLTGSELETTQNRCHPHRPHRPCVCAADWLWSERFRCFSSYTVKWSHWPDSIQSDSGWRNVTK